MWIRHLATKTPAYLPDALLDFNLLNLFIVYVASMFVISTALRARFYRAVWEIAVYVKNSCPAIFELLEKNWSQCVRDGVIVRCGYFAVVFIPYVVFTRFVFPQAHISLRQLVDISPLLTVSTLILAGLMVGIDFFLVFQVTRVDAAKIKSDLEFGERWLGGRVAKWFDLLGSWNPIRRYAHAITQDSMSWFNEVFRNSVSVMILQTVLRITLGAFLIIGVDLMS